MDANGMRETELKPSPHDYILRPWFKIVSRALDITLIRFVLACYLFPIYVFVKFLSVLPITLSQSKLLLTTNGRARLIRLTASYREQEEQQAAQQLDGTFSFQLDQVLKDEEGKGWLANLAWKPHREEVLVCGAMVSVVHEVPDNAAMRSGKTIVLLHGNPSWSFVWRNIIPALVKGGHEVYAIDWLGHGASDKPLSGSSISFELHMRTLTACIDHFNISDCYVAAHDWGGCVALCTIPQFPMGTCSGIFLLNTFFPPRPTDISLHYYLLYQIWFFSTGIFDGYLPEWGVMRFMCPSATSTIISGYSAPYSAGVATKASVTRFAHIVPGIPDTILSLRSTYWWCLIEGLLNPWNFTNINAQAALAERNVDIREWWAASSSSQSKNSMPKVLVAFGEDDPLLKEFKEVLVLTFPSKTLVRCPNGSWIPHAGHYPMEEKPYVIADLLCNFVIDSSSL